MSEGTPSECRKSSRTHDIRKALVLRKAFDVYDKDRSGAIDHEELRSLLQDLGWPSDDSFLHRAINVLDTDNSGEIGFSEFLQWTEFAYTARVLYRDEMSSPVRTAGSSADVFGIQGTQPYAWKHWASQEGNQPIQKELSGASTTLPTVFEEPECETGYEEVHPFSNQNGESADGEHTFSSINASISPCSRHIYGSNKSSGQKTASDERSGRDDDVEFSAPVRKTATMTLSRYRHIRKSTTRIRSKSVENHQCFGFLPRGRLQSRGDGKSTGPRMRSKATARMVWACEQLRTRCKADDCEEETIDFSEHRKNEPQMTDMGKQETELREEQKMEGVLSILKYQRDRRRCGRYSCVDNLSRKPQVESIQSAEDLEDDMDPNMKKASSI
eukprot:TRINITY_DN63054_c0_g1_i1.p1 TRINITY_DN63054_c0_g1~~TRINITY_DN63054_c0_g1_i1.p1  ORF type:complete len:386 (-),score=42.17 TRINITY_DN63054_c0_g1_i1:403-1560(-)